MDYILSLSPLKSMSSMIFERLSLCFPASFLRLFRNFKPLVENVILSISLSFMVLAIEPPFIDKAGGNGYDI